MFEMRIFRFLIDSLASVDFPSLITIVYPINISYSISFILPRCELLTADDITYIIINKLHMYVYKDPQVKSIRNQISTC